jgi:hypothetical protein
MYLPTVPSRTFGEARPAGRQESRRYMSGCRPKASACGRNKRQIALMLLATIISSNHNKRWKPKERVSWRLLVLFLPFQDTGRTINKSACGCKVKG